MKNELHNVISGSDESGKPPRSIEPGPNVGIFYVVGGKLYWEGIPIERASTSTYVKIYPKKHAAYWKGCLVRLEPHLGKYDPDHFPRGRVVFSTQEGVYRLFADKCILDDSDMIKKIVSKMRLPEPKVNISWDIDCECAECKSNRIHHDNNTERRINVPFKITKDGRKLFFPYGSLGRGYLIPSDQEYQRLRRGQRLWLKIGVPLTVPVGIVAHHFTEFLTGSFRIGLIMLVVFSLLFCVPFAVWNWKQYRNMEQTDDN